MIDGIGELNPLNPLEYQKNAVKAAQAGTEAFKNAHPSNKARVEEYIKTIPKPGVSPDTAKISAVRGALNKIATSKPLEIAVPKGMKATGAGNSGFGKVMFFTSIALAPVFLGIGVIKEAIGKGYQKLKASIPPILPR